MKSMEIRTGNGGRHSPRRNPGGARAVARSTWRGVALFALAFVLVELVLHARKGDVNRAVSRGSKALHGGVRPGAYAAKEALAAPAAPAAPAADPVPAPVPAPAPAPADHGGANAAARAAAPAGFVPRARAALLAGNPDNVAPAVPAEAPYSPAGDANAPLFPADPLLADGWPRFWARVMTAPCASVAPECELVPSWGGCCNTHRVLKGKLVAVADHLRRVGWPHWWVHAGTMIGLVRERGNLIPHDNDMDINIFAKWGKSYREKGEITFRNFTRRLLAFNGRYPPFTVLAGAHAFGGRGPWSTEPWASRYHTRNTPKADRTREGYVHTWGDFMVVGGDDPQHYNPAAPYKNAKRWSHNNAHADLIMMRAWGEGYGNACQSTMLGRGYWRQPAAYTEKGGRPAPCPYGLRVLNETFHGVNCPSNTVEYCEHTYGSGPHGWLNREVRAHSEKVYYHTPKARVHAAFLKRFHGPEGSAAARAFAAGTGSVPGAGGDAGGAPHAHAADAHADAIAAANAADTAAAAAEGGKGHTGGTERRRRLGGSEREVSCTCTPAPAPPSPRDAACPKACRGLPFAGCRSGSGAGSQAVVAASRACEHWCSPQGYCGSSGEYKAKGKGTACGGCKGTVPTAEEKGAEGLKVCRSANPEHWAWTDADGLQAELDALSRKEEGARYAGGFLQQ